MQEFGIVFSSFSGVICEIDEDIFGSKTTLTAVVCLHIPFSGPDISPL